MRRHLAAAAIGAAALLGTAACGSPPGAADAPDVVEACNEYNRLINDWSVDYGKEIGAVAQAEAAGDEARADTAVQVVRELFIRIADRLRDQAEIVSDEELTDALAEAADGLDEISAQIETYEDVESAPELMNEGDFARGGERVGDLCAQ